MVILKQSHRDRLPFKCLIGPLSPVFSHQQHEQGLLLTHPQCVGDYLEHPDIVPFYMHPATFKINTQINTQDLLFGGPAGYQIKPLIERIQTPDQATILIWWGFHFALPQDLKQCHIKRFLIVSDWHFHAEVINEYIEQFDQVFSDRQMKDYLHQKGFHSVEYWPAYSFTPALLEQAPQKKIIDVCFLGNTNPAYYQQRNLYLRRLSALDPNYRIVICNHIPHPDYGHILGASKLVFNHSLRSEMNLRAYEAAICSSLQLIEDSNLEVRDFLADACVLYNQQNFEALIHYYLKHDAEREILAQKAHQQIQKYSYTEQFTNLLHKIQAYLDKPQAIQTRHSNIMTDGHQTQEQALLLHIKHLLSTDLAELRARALELVEAFIQLSSEYSLPLLNAWAVCRLDYESLILNQQSNYKAQSTLRQISQLLDSTAHHDIHSLNNLAWLAFFQSDWTLLARSLNLLQANLLSPTQIQSDILLLPLRYTSLYILRQQAFAKYKKNSLELKEPIFRAIQWSLNYLKGNLLLQQATQVSLLQACNCFSQACQIQPELVEAWFELARCYQILQDPVKAIQALQTGLAQGVYYPGAWLKLIELLQQTGQKDVAREAIRQASRLFQDPKFKDIQTQLANLLSSK